MIKTFVSLFLALLCKGSPSGLNAHRRLGFPFRSPRYLQIFPWLDYFTVKQRCAPFLRRSKSANAAALFCYQRNMRSCSNNFFFGGQLPSMCSGRTWERSLPNTGAVQPCCLNSACGGGRACMGLKNICYPIALCIFFVSVHPRVRDREREKDSHMNACVCVCARAHVSVSLR